MLITLAISAIIVLASAIGTIAGFGTATIVVPIFLLIFPLPQTLLLGGIIHWFNDLARLGLF
ncbi:MAG: sulfite exporter TauE/SafE family protein, partial [Candidatus Niyogibacteria bacterium]|nr:sulfite exporter TauE/SafE family protein [Candidatus Niyogibacteria bacterium]